MLFCDLEPFAEIAEGEAFAVLAERQFGRERLALRSEQWPRIASVRLGDCALTLVDAGAHLVEARPEDRRSFDPDSLKLLVTLTGFVRLIGETDRASLGPGGSCFYDPTRPHVVAVGADAQLFLLQVPRSQATLSWLDSGRMFREPLPGSDQPILRLARSISATNREARQWVGLRMLGELAAIFEPRRETSLEVLLRRIERHVRENLDSAELTIGSIARRMGCSARYVHRAFDLWDCTPADYIWRTRLQRARDRLTSPALQKLSISEIALSVGFSSSAHFARAFRARYDISPRELRRQVLSPAP